MLISCHAGHTGSEKLVKMCMKDVQTLSQKESCEFQRVLVLIQQLVGKRAIFQTKCHVPSKWVKIRRRIFYEKSCMIPCLDPWQSKQTTYYTLFRSRYARKKPCKTADLGLLCPSKVKCSNISLMCCTNSTEKVFNSIVEYKKWSASENLVFPDARLLHHCGSPPNSRIWLGIS